MNATEYDRATNHQQNMSSKIERNFCQTARHNAARGGAAIILTLALTQSRPSRGHLDFGALR